MEKLTEVCARVRRQSDNLIKIIFGGPGDDPGPGREHINGQI